MKLVIAVIQPTKFSAVREALEKMEVHRMTVCDGQGFGPQRKRAVPLQPGTRLGGGFFSSGEGFSVIREVVLEIVVNDDFLQRTIEAISTMGRTGPDGTLGDGKIMVLPADDMVMIDDASRGPGAV